MLRLGISCHYHDSAAAIVDDSEIKFAIQEERLSRRKHDRRFPALAIARGLQACGLPINDLASIVFYEDPQLKLNRLWDQVIDNWPRSRRMFEQDTNILRRASEFNRRRAVELNLLMLGWHPLPDNRNVRSALTDFVEKFRIPFCSQCRQR